MKIDCTDQEKIYFKEIENIEQELSDVELNDIASQSVDDKHGGFIGKAHMFGDEVFINTFTGEGYDIVIDKMQRYISWHASKIRLSGFDVSDIKQLIAMILLDGIRRYNPNLKIKLSTFLYVHIKNRIITRIQEETRQSLNATYIAPVYKFVCTCGNTFISSKKDVTACTKCNKNLDDTWNIRPRHCEPTSLDGIMSSKSDGDFNNKADNSQYHGQKSGIVDLFGRVDTAEDVEHNLDFAYMINNEDEITRKIANLMYNNDYSITAAAKEVGLTCWAASLRLKKLKKKKLVREFFLNA